MAGQQSHGLWPWLFTAEVCKSVVSQDAEMRKKGDQMATLSILPVSAAGIRRLLTAHVFG
jgi:hypothetical protein